MRAAPVVIVLPRPDDLARFGQAREHMLIEALVAQLAVEALDERVLCRLARLDVVPSDWRKAKISSSSSARLRNPETRTKANPEMRSHISETYGAVPKTLDFWPFRIFSSRSALTVIHAMAAGATSSYRLVSRATPKLPRSILNPPRWSHNPA